MKETLHKDDVCLSSVNKDTSKDLFPLINCSYQCSCTAQPERDYLAQVQINLSSTFIILCVAILT